MYGNCGKRVVPETANPNPVGYAKYYYQAEEPFLKSILRGKNVIMLRAPWVIGNGSWFQFLYKKPVLETGELPMYGDSGRVMSLITVEDCAALLIYYAMNAQPGIYNIYSHQMIYADFLELIRKSSKRVVDISPSKRLDRTTINSICTEIILGTNYPDLLNAYKLKNPLLDNYVERLMHS